MKKIENNLLDYSVANKGVFLVGGAPRSFLMGETPSDYDYVLIGFTANEIVNMGGVKVGKEAEVYLLKPFFKPHENIILTQEEHRLARTEESTGDGYNDFDFNTEGVSLLEDLSCRDLTVNAMAYNENWELIDPFNGEKDLENKILRHVYHDGMPNKEAFSEDPVRILRAARFASRYSDFTIAPETIELMKDMVKKGMISSLSPDRVWKELMKVFKEDKPSIFFKVLDDIGALDILFPELSNLKGKHQNPKYHFEGDSFIHTLMVLDKAAEVSTANNLNDEDRSLVLFGSLYHDLGKGLTPTKLHSLGKHHGHDSMTKTFELENDVKEVLKVNDKIEEVTLPALLKFIEKRLGANSKKYIKFAGQSILSHQIFHNFDTLNAKTKVSFFTKPDKLSLTHKTDRRIVELLTLVANSDNAGRIFLTVDETKSSDLVIDGIHYSENTSDISEYHQKDDILEVFDIVTNIGIKDTNIDLDDIKNIKPETIQVKIYGARLDAVKKIDADKKENILIEKKEQENKIK